MRRQFVGQLQPRQDVDEVYRVVDKQLRTNRQGNLYLLMQLADRTGMVSGMRWNADQRMYESFQKGEFVRVIGATQLFNGGLQLIINDLEPLRQDQVNLEDFSTHDAKRTQILRDELRSQLDAIKNPSLKLLVDALLGDAALMDKFSMAPAGVKNHHAHPGGLLEHVVDLLKLASVVADRYPQVDRDLLLIGVLLHDIGKVEELAFENEWTYSDPGQLIGHLVQGIQILQTKLTELKQAGHAFPDALKWRVEHMIVSHHGSLDHGSPKVPMTLEAIVLHYLDDLDAKVNAATELIRGDLNSDSVWTNFIPTLGRKLYKPSVVKSENENNSPK